jgi:hypothetical protein
MSGKTLLQVSRRRTSAPRGTPDQERFKYLIAQIERVRKERLDWDSIVVEFRKGDAQRIQPLRTALKAVTRETVLAIDKLLEQPGWSRVDRAALRDILRGTAEMLLDADPHDAEIKAAFDRHGEVGFDDAKREELEALKEHAKDYMGVDLDDAEIRSEEDLIQRMYQHMAEREQAEAAERDERAQKRRKSAAQQRVEANAQAARQFLREIYRKLASAVHPDREADAARRAEKNELMQKINRAYATNDLLTLLEAQMRLEQIDPEHVARLSGERLKQYNKLLSEQLESAKNELYRLQNAFRQDHDLAHSQKITPQTLHLILQQRAREVRAHVTRQKHFLEVLASKTAIKRWLKEQRRFGMDWDDE